MSEASTKGEDANGAESVVDKAVVEAEGVGDDVGDNGVGGAQANEEEEEDEEDDDEDEDDDDGSLEELKARVAAMKEEADKLNTIQEAMSASTASPSSAGSASLTSGGAAGGGPGASGSAAEADDRSVFVGNVDFGSTPEELQAHFSSCGVINRITILCDKWTGKPKGFAYIEFADTDAVANAMLVNESLFRGRPLKVLPKRSNKPGLGRRRRRRRSRRRWSYNPY